jgi:hypothetical protein
MPVSISTLSMRATKKSMVLTDFALGIKKAIPVIAPLLNLRIVL